VSTLESWKVLAGGGDAVILAVDYERTGRQEAGFSDLAARMGNKWAVWESLPPPRDERTAPAGEEYIDWWLGPVRAASWPVRAVFGYCVGGAFASVLADRVAAVRQARPALIVFDPKLPAASSLYDDFMRAMDQFDSFLLAEELDQARQAAADAVLDYGDDFAALGATLVRIFGESADIAFQRVRVAAAFRGELVAAFESYMSYVVAACQLEPSFETATAIISSSPSNEFNVAAQELRFDIDRKNLLSDSQVVQAVVDILSAGNHQ
jgi:hypothetical protein